MNREKAKDVYFSKPTPFGNGAKIKSYKEHLNEEMVIMTKTKYEEYMEKVLKSKEISEKDDKKARERYAKEVATYGE